jgi:hypothetical protein
VCVFVISSVGGKAVSAKGAGHEKQAKPTEERCGKKEDGQNASDPEHKSDAGSCAPKLPLHAEQMIRWDVQIGGSA